MTVRGSDPGVRLGSVGGIAGLIVLSLASYPLVLCGRLLVAGAAMLRTSMHGAPA